MVTTGVAVTGVVLTVVVTGRPLNDWLRAPATQHQIRTHTIIGQITKNRMKKNTERPIARPMLTGRGEKS